MVVYRMDQHAVKHVPVSEYCLAYRHGTVEELPVKAPKKERILQNRTVLVIQDGEKTAIQKRPEKGLLAGLYELPNLLGHLTREEVLDKVKICSWNRFILRNFRMRSIFFRILNGG